MLLPGWRRPASCPGGCAGRLPALAGTIAGLAVLVGFLTWAAAGRDLPFPVSNQFAGTLSLATPLVFGALCGVLCERAGVVNVSIEGQFLAAAFAAAVVGSVTQSIPVAMIAAVIAGVAMAALLALFSINYLVNQVVLGVVLNLLAVGVTGFLFDQLVQPASRTYNSAPVLESIPIPGLSDIPFFGRVLFEQNDPGLPGRRSPCWWSGWCCSGPPGGCGSGPSASTRRRPTPSASASAASAGRRCWPAACSPVSAARSSPWPRPGRSPRSSPSATASSRWPR